MIDEQIIIEQLKLNKWEVAYENIDLVSEEEYKQIRQIGFGASDSSKLLNVNPFPKGTQKDLIKEKLTGEFDDAISRKASVRKGKDLEPLIIKKINEATELNLYLYKPKNMYKDSEQTGLTVNFDGVGEFTDVTPSWIYFPVEIKVVTKYGRKYYDFSKAIFYQEDGIWKERRPAPVLENFVELTIEEKAHALGIPVYYFTQVQQQMIPLGSSFGYLAVLDEEDWNIYIFIIPRDGFTINELKKQGVLAGIELNMAKQKQNPED